MDQIPKVIREILPETIDGLREFIHQAELELARINKKIVCARLLLKEKEG